MIFYLNQYRFYLDILIILQVLPGSHKAGRIEHKFVAGQTGGLREGGAPQEGVPIDLHGDGAR